MVITIALLVPTLSGLRQTSNAAKCASNLKRIGEDFQLYLNDNAGLLPNLPVIPRSPNEILMQLAGYAEAARGRTDTDRSSVSYWVCPSDPSKGGWIKHGAPYGFEGDPQEVGILAHSYLPNRLVLGFRILEISRPSQSILVADFPWARLSTRSIVPMDSPWKESFPKDWHQDSINCLFIDGHVERLPIDTLTWGGSNTSLWYADYPESGTRFRE